jgi:hypothetical protein
LWAGGQRVRELASSSQSPLLVGANERTVTMTPCIQAAIEVGIVLIPAVFGYMLFLVIRDARERNHT